MGTAAPVARIGTRQREIRTRVLGVQAASQPTGGVSSGYIRGSGGVSVDGRKVLRLLSVTLLLGLVILSVGLAIATSHRHSRLSALRSRGVSVPVTVNSCLGISSGVGMSIEYWQCRGSFVLDGQTFDRVIGGSRTLLEHDQVVPGRVLPDQPSSVYLSSAIPPPEAGIGSYTASLASGAAAAVLAGGLVSIEARRRRRPQP